MSRKSNSFTLVEIIAVLLVIAIMAAVAAPKFINMADTAREGVAQAGVNEAKATLSVAYAEAYLADGKLATPLGVEGDDVATTAFPTLVTGGTVAFGDIDVVFTFSAGSDDVGLSATVGTKTVTDTWSVPDHAITAP